MILVGTFLQHNVQTIKSILFWEITVLVTSLKFVHPSARPTLQFLQTSVVKSALLKLNLGQIYV